MSSHLPQGFDPKILEDFPYLNLSPADLDLLFQGDPVLREYDARIKDYQAKIADYENRRVGFREDLERLADQRAELEAALKHNDTQTREVRGADAGIRYHINLAGQRIKEREAAGNRRKKKLYENEVRKRLAALGKELRLGMGRRTTGAAVVDRKAA